MYDNDKKTILIVDDEQSIITLLELNLEKEGYNTISASDRTYSSRNCHFTKTRFNTFRYNVT